MDLLKIVGGVLLLLALAYCGLALSRKTGAPAGELVRRGVRVPRHLLDLPPVVDPHQWQSFADAARDLGLPERKLRAALAAGAVERARNGADEVGVTRTSVERELAWQRTATTRDRARRLATVVLSYLPLQVPLP